LPFSLTLFAFHLIQIALQLHTHCLSLLWHLCGLQTVSAASFLGAVPDEPPCLSVSHSLPFISYALPFNCALSAFRSFGTFVASRLCQLHPSLVQSLVSQLAFHLIVIALRLHTHCLSSHTRSLSSHTRSLSSHTRCLSFHTHCLPPHVHCRSQSNIICLCCCP